MIRTISRPLDDIRIRRSSTGRDVEAYAAVFDTPAEVHDRHGHYIETIHRTAFDGALAAGVTPAVYYHHGMTMHGTPARRATPIGEPLLVKADRRGLLTVTRYHHGDLADAVLEAIRNGDIRSYSFRGHIHLRVPGRITPAGPGEPLPKVTLYRLGLTEYGPTPRPLYADARITAIRAARSPAQWHADIRNADQNHRRQLKLRAAAATLAPIGGAA
ncbi:HK97 family phage prohead protease [Micromonospora sp. WMMA1923]|uniref:HK97 family phage prohead protease n=1 Tax=Micromonospora sp. WMMA1923 TaxID=3404125 RepID=UPI003B953E88